MKPISSLVSVIWLQLAVLKVARSNIFPFIVGVIVPEVVLNLISSNPQEVPASVQKRFFNQLVFLLAPPDPSFGTRFQLRKGKTQTQN